MINGDDELVGELTGRALKNAGEDKTERAEAMRKFVNRYINQKGLATAFATASETARTRAGDCSEHAVLLCALLRADDIPSRVATGLIYADRFAGERDIFGWHMWSQALIDGKWIDLDATLPVPYDATHILCSTSSLADGTGELSALMMMMGNLEIEVVEVDYSK